MIVDTYSTVQDLNLSDWVSVHNFDLDEFMTALLLNSSLRKNRPVRATPSLRTQRWRSVKCRWFGRRRPFEIISFCADLRKYGPNPAFSEDLIRLVWRCGPINLTVGFGGLAPSCRHHADRWSSLCCHDGQTLLRETGFRASMRGKGKSDTLAAVESFLKSLRAKLIWRGRWPTCRGTIRPASNTAQGVSSSAPHA